MTDLNKYELYRLHSNYGRMGNVTGLFFAEPAQVESMFGENVYLGEVLGKHSNVWLEVNASVLQKIELPLEAKQALWDNIGDHLSGINPIGNWVEQLWDKLYTEYTEKDPNLTCEEVQAAIEKDPRWEMFLS